MKKYARTGIAILLTALLFSLYIQILNYFAAPIWIPLLALTALFALLTAACIFLPRFLPPQCTELIQRGLIFYHRAETTFYSLFSDKTLFFQFWGILSLFYIPAYLCQFPGTYGYDPPIQIAQYFKESTLTSHHPVAHTWLIGFFFSLGNTLFKSYTVGFALYTALQGLSVTGALAYSLLACKRHRVPLIWILIGALWAAVNPFLQVLSFSSTKDILFGVFLLCFSVALWDFLDYTHPRRSHHVRLVIFGVMACLFRNQGIYIMLVLLLLCLLLRTRKKGLCTCLAIVYLIPQIFFVQSVETFHIPKGDAKEMLCVPMQQMARVCASYAIGGDVDVTPEQYMTVSELIYPEAFLMYIPDAADTVKNYFRTEVLNEDFGKYLSVYISLGLQNPREYLLAWVDLIRPYWDMCSNEYKGLAFTYTFPEMNHWDIYHAGLIQPYFFLLYDKISAPRYSLLWRPESCLWLLAAMPGLAVARRRKRLIICTLPLGLYLATTLLGPVALLRYLFPLTLATPLLLGMLFQRKPLVHRRPKNSKKPPVKGTP